MPCYIKQSLRISACCDSQTCFTLTTSNASVCTELTSLLSKDVQTDIGCILSLCGLLPDHPPGDVQPDSRLELRLLPKVFGDYSVQCLQIQLLNSPALSLVRLEKLLRTFVSQRFKLYRQRTWNIVANSINQLLDTYHLNNLLQSPTEMHVPSNSVPLAARISQPPLCALPVNPVDVESGVESDIDESEDQFTRVRIEHRLSQLVVALFELQIKLNSTREKLEAAEKLSEQNAIAGTTTKIYQSTISRIKQEVMAYVQTCQTRAAQTLHSELARVHRRACRQFTVHLRRALCEAGAPVTHFSASSHVVFPGRRQSNSLPRPTITVSCTPPLTSLDGKQMQVGSESHAGGDCGPDVQSTDSREPPPLPTDLESLLHVIDNVCASAESQFQADFSTGSAVFERSNKNTPLPAKLRSGSPSHTVPAVVVSTEASSIPLLPGGLNYGSRHNATNNSQLSPPHTENLCPKWLHQQPSQTEGISPTHKLVGDCTSVSAVPLLNITIAHPVHTCHPVSRSQSATDNTRLSSTRRSVTSTTISPHIPQACVTVRRGPKWETIGHPLPPPRHLRTILSGGSVNVLTTTTVITQTTNTSAALSRHSGQPDAGVLSQTLSHLNPRCYRRRFLYPNLSPVSAFSPLLAAVHEPACKPTSFSYQPDLMHSQKTQDIGGKPLPRLPRLMSSRMCISSSGAITEGLDPSGSDQPTVAPVQLCVQTAGNPKRVHMKLYRLLEQLQTPAKQS
ncbi:hypothetical protein P879_09759 [Paragonimus westermani]|uniref:CEP152 CEP63 binding coiled coil domain-containing protein n=1 Tax=Paragonimus westermani TaxID=34504 RepID=A0A8T0DA95_9TREM|nr:hypothetical protein P879_09759 [Paragonimus westermani]